MKREREKREGVAITWFQESYVLPATPFSEADQAVGISAYFSLVKFTYALT